MNLHRELWERHENQYNISEDTLNYLLDLLDESIEKSDNTLVERAIELIQQIITDEYIEPIFPNEEFIDEL
jgi:uncharacterized protein YecA (UPF0149 family)